MNPGDIGRRIKELREKAGWTQMDLVRYSKVGQTTINLVESGTRSNIRADTIVQFAQAFRVTTDYILGYDVEKVPERVEPDSPAVTRRIATVERQVGEVRSDLVQVQREVVDLHKEVTQGFASLLAQRENPKLARSKKSSGRRRP